MIGTLSFCACWLAVGLANGNVSTVMGGMVTVSMFCSLSLWQSISNVPNSTVVGVFGTDCVCTICSPQPTVGNAYFGVLTHASINLSKASRSHAEISLTNQRM